MAAPVIVEAPQPVLDRIVDRLIESFIEDSAQTEGYRWCAELDACPLSWQKRTGARRCSV